jgi:hypothetical protein
LKTGALVFVFGSEFLTPPHPHAGPQAPAVKPHPVIPASLSGLFLGYSKEKIKFICLFEKTILIFSKMFPYLVT